MAPLRRHHGIFSFELLDETVLQYGKKFGTAQNLDDLLQILMDFSFVDEVLHQSGELLIDFLAREDPLEVLQVDLLLARPPHVDLLFQLLQFEIKGAFVAPAFDARLHCLCQDKLQLESQIVEDFRVAFRVHPVRRNGLGIKEVRQTQQLLLVAVLHGVETLAANVPKQLYNKKKPLDFVRVAEMRQNLLGMS